MTYPPQPPEPNPQGAPGQGAPGAAPDFATEWGIKENPNRPKKVNQLTQLLWVYAAASVLAFVFAILASATAVWWYSTGTLIGSGVWGLILGAFAVAIAWAVNKDKLGMFGASDPRLPLYIGLGLLGLFSLSGFWGVWGIGWYAALGSLLALAKLAAVGLSFYLVLQPEVEQYLRSRPGNLPKPPAPPQYPGGGQPPQTPPAAGQQVPPGYPNEM